MNWFYYSLFSSVLWGFSYAMSDKLVNSLNVFTIMTVAYCGGFLISLSLALTKGSLKHDFSNITPKLASMILFVILANSTAVYFINNAIQQKNATYAGLVEICYPFFTLLATYLIFGEIQITIRSAIGALFILIGIFFMSKV